jgi:hypothetical protein
MTAARRQLDLGFDEIESIRQLAGALQGTVDDLVQRYRPVSNEISSKIVHQHTKKALRLARGLAMCPSTRATIDAAYKMVRRELGEIE